MASTDLRESVLLNLRSVTQSCKGGVPFNRLQDDYSLLLGSPIPFRELGYNSLEAFLRDIPHVVSLKNNAEGRLTVEGVADATTAHIVSLVSRQKQSETRKKRFSKSTSYFNRRTTMQRPRVGYSSRPPYNYYPSTYPSNYYPNNNTYHPSGSNNTYHPSSSNNTYHPSSSNRVVAQHSKPRYENEQVPQKKYETPPRFQKQKAAKLPPQTVSSPPPRTVSSPPPRTVSSPPPRTVSSPVPQQEYPSSPSSSSSKKSVKSSKKVAPVTVKSPMRSLTRKPLVLNTHRNTQLNALESTRTAKEFIEVYSKMNGLNVDYRSSLMGQKKHKQSYICTLDLGDKRYQLYPDSKPSAKEAEEAVANIAMESIKKENLANYPETPYGNAEKIRILLTRIEEIVCEKPSGMFGTGIIREYENKFHETLPHCWLDLLKSSSCVDIEELEIKCGRVPDRANFIVRPVKELSSGNHTPSSTSSKSDHVYEDLDAKTLKNTLVNISKFKAPEIKLPEGNLWELYITNVVDWFSARLYEYSADFLSLSSEMSEFYKNKDHSVTDILISHVYAACMDENPHIWHRVIVDDVYENQVYCYLVDEGNFADVRRDNLQELSSQFLELPYQAIQISLNGIEEMASYISDELLEESLLGKTLIAEVKSCRTLPKFFLEISGIHRTLYSVILYDTSDDSEVDLNINQSLKRYIIESMTCKLPKMSTTVCAYLSHVSSEGNIYLRLTPEENCIVEQELKRLTPDFEEACSQTQKVPSTSVMCTAKYQSISWHRAIITESHCPYPGMVEVIFVDFGQLDYVKKSEICELEPISEILASVSHQAVMCELHDVVPVSGQWTKTAIEALVNLAPSNQELIVRVMCEDNPPKVKLYKRNQESNIVSINHLLSSNPNLFKEKPTLHSARAPQDLNLNDQVRKLSLKNTLSNSIPDVAFSAEEHMAKIGSIVSPVNIEWINTPDNIKSPEAFETLCNVPVELPSIPEKGQYLDVFVTMAANPHNFVVQPLNFCKDLDKLMDDMRQFYSNDENLLEIDFNMLRSNDYYAVLHTDNSWYRVRIDKILSPAMVVVYFVDFGDFTVVDVSKLQPLYNQFKMLPRLAIKASLGGVKPVDSDWDPQQALQFCSMITEKSLVSIIHQKELLTKDNIPEYKLELVLVDTSDKSNDVYIHEILISRGFAKSV